MSGMIRHVQALVALFIKMVMVHALTGCSGSLPFYSSGKKASIKDSRQKEQKMPKLVRGPYLQMVNGSSATLRWRTDIPTDSRLEVGISHGHYILSVNDSVFTTEHEIRITGLKEDTRYYYRFGSSSFVLQHGKDNYFTTAPPPATTRKIRVAVFGDCGTNDWFNQTLSLRAYRRHVKQEPAELMLLLGDNAYDDGLDHE
ncbi:MAG TPA: fibronectin type III domain-containing protein, partial [Chitinophagaceae bacterium]